jgi:hypothetical protein
LGIDADVEPAALSTLLGAFQCHFLVQLNKAGTAPERIISARLVRKALMDSDGGNDGGLMDKESLEVFLSEIGTTQFMVVDKDVPLGSFFDRDDAAEEEDDVRESVNAVVKRERKKETKEVEAFYVVVDKSSIPVGIVQRSFDL